MMKHNDKMVDTRDYPITRGTLEHAALQASWRTAQRSEAHAQQRRKQLIAWACAGLIMAAGLAAMGALALALWGGR